HQFVDVHARKKAICWPFGSPLTDSNRRPPSYHALRDGCRGLPSVAVRPFSAVFERVPFATGCHRLRPLGSINAPSIRRESLMTKRASGVEPSACRVLSPSSQRGGWLPVSLRLKPLRRQDAGAGDASEQEGCGW